MKYIPTDKLKAEIERRMENYNATIEKYCGKQKSIKAERDSWKWAECKWFLNLITSLQQEQPAKRGYKDCNGCENNRLLKDQIGWQFRGCFGGDYKGKPIAEIELCPLKVINQQEQPEVDLEKEIDDWYNGNGIPVSTDALKETARHFYELGKNSK